jgi:hypothetical protein
MAPFDLAHDFGTWAVYLVPLLIGIGFGSVLEASGFGDSRKLAAQFYLTDLTVLKVMFTGIVTASVLLFLSSAIGILDFDNLFVNPTFLVPGIVGGLIMGVGFIVGGFCPGTSLVSAATFKIDGIVFAIGVALGIFAFGETVYLFQDFWFSTSFGRFMLPELLGLSAGTVVLLVVLMALFMFYLAELAEQFFGRRIPVSKLSLLPSQPRKMAAAGTLAGLAVIGLLVGQPSADEHWQELAEINQPLVDSRAIFIHPGEVAELMADPAVYTRFIDVRSERDFNLFHLRGALSSTSTDLNNPQAVRELLGAPPNTVVFVVSNDETRALHAWKRLMAHHIPNLYIIEGGINNWLKVYPPPPCLAEPLPAWRELGDDDLAFVFKRAVGDCCNAARPDQDQSHLPPDCLAAKDRQLQAPHGNFPKPEFEHKVKLERKESTAGGCG